MDTQIPVIVENPVTDCGWRRTTTGRLTKFLNFPRTTHRTKTQHVTESRGRHCGDVDLTVCLANSEGPQVSLVLDLHITHDRFGSNSDLNLNGHLHYPNGMDKSLNEGVDDKIRKYRVDFYSYRLIGKLSAFLQFQEFSLLKPTVDSSTSVSWCSFHISKQELV
jgi:hypothetical protein